jgi:hypothetical protein
MAQKWIVNVIIGFISGFLVGGFVVGLICLWYVRRHAQLQARVAELAELEKLDGQ